MPEEMILVEILPKVKLYHVGTVDYLPGDKLTVPKSHFRADFMRIIPAPIVKKAEPEAPKPETPTPASTKKGKQP